VWGVLVFVVWGWPIGLWSSRGYWVGWFVWLCGGVVVRL